MMASKDAIGMITANMKDTFGAADVLAEGVNAEGQEAFLAKMQALPADQRQRVLSVAVEAIRKSMAEGQDI